MKQNNITWHSGHNNQEKKKHILNQKGTVIWLTGLSASGKSTIGVELENELLNHGFLSYRLDGDNLRFGLNKDLGFSDEDRKENIRRAAETANILKDAGMIVIASFITPKEELRSMVKSIIKEDLIQAYVKADINTCINRDPKGLYKKALDGTIKNFTGISDIFEEPSNCDVVIDTDEFDLKECVNKLLCRVLDYQK